MDEKREKEIYDRMGELLVKVDVSGMPSPQYISQKIGQCHLYIEEVEGFLIQTNQELSVLQRSLNNATMSYEQEINDLISSDPEITNLPSVRDREARASTRLKDKHIEIRNLKNEVTSLEIMQKTINSKMKNLSRLNLDIKVQLRLMESQIKLGGPANSATDDAVRSLMEELNKSKANEDIFEGMETTQEETKIQDPSVPLDVNSLLNTGINNPPIPESTPVVDLDVNLALEERAEEDLEVEEGEETLEPDVFPLGEPTEDSSGEPENSAVIDLDKLLDPVSEHKLETKPGGAPAKKEEEIQKESESQKITQNTSDIDIDALLGQFK